MQDMNAVLTTLQRAAGIVFTEYYLISFLNLIFTSFESKKKTKKHAQ